ncbi:MAG: DUF2505 family protein [Acidimicrobiales bacterium]
MRFRLDQLFEARLDSVQSALVDPDFLASLAELPNLGRPELVSQSWSGTELHQKVRHRFSGHLSAVVTAVVDPNRLTWVEESVLDAETHRTRFRILPDHYPDRLSCSGTFSLSPGADRDTTERITEGSIKVSFPLVGGRVEEAIVSGLRDHARLEVAAVGAWLQHAN